MTHIENDNYMNTLEFIPFMSAVRLLNNHEKDDIEILKQSLVLACRKQEVKCRPIAGIVGSCSHIALTHIELSSTYYISCDQVEINRESFMKWAKKMELDSIQKISDEEINPRKERVYTNIIGALLSCVTGDFKDKTFSSETELRTFLADKYKGFYGVTQRTLAAKFAEAKKSLED